MSQRSLYRILVAAAAFGGLLLTGPLVSGQSLDMMGPNDDTPLEVTAEDGLEWRQDEKVFIATGNARAQRGDTDVRADELRAHYRDRDGQASAIWRLEATGHVVITAADGAVYGDAAAYDLDQAVAVVTGTNPYMLAGADRVSARKSLEYWLDKNLAVARGDAHVIHGDQQLTADLLMASMVKDKTGASSVSRVDAQGNVRIVTKDEVVIADKGVYTVDAETVTLSGNVKITRGANQLNGCGAVVNLKSGVSRLSGCAGTKNRVRGLLVPEKKKKP